MKGSFSSVIEINLGNCAFLPSAAEPGTGESVLTSLSSAALWTKMTAAVLGTRLLDLST